MRIKRHFQTLQDSLRSFRYVLADSHPSLFMERKLDGILFLHLLFKVHTSLTWHLDGQQYSSHLWLQTIR